ncbi:olfactomedin-like protein 3 isoform X3 [Synchiropus splendidus]|uniref:olfactomedin-like protein 3 isoform X3 n=1 Tax=Synchiropus splendidus TaxID=270530 RepID=UPI00237E7F19|nr:olfactomedin-like protein 3 isoform X3 [Synchiropus splendidus]
MPQMRPGSGRVGEGGWTVPHLDQNLSAAGTDDRSESGSDWVEPVPNMDRSFILLLALCLTCSPVRSQSPGQDSFIIQYLERRLLQMEERLSRCEQNTARLTQTTYDLSSQVRAHRSTVHVLQSEVRSQVDGVSARVDRVERELEYLEKKIPLSSDIQMEEALLEQQIQAAELELIQNRAKLQLQSADCSVALSQIKSLKIVKKTGDVSGSWFKDPTAGSQKIYLLSGVRNHTLLEFGSLQSFSSATPPPRVLQLPASWQGTGHVVYGGFLFYHKADTPNQILKVSLESGGVVDSALLPGAGRLPVYGLNPDTYLHLAVDQLGLWVLHADPDYAGNLILTKLDKASLAVELTWDTPCQSRDAEGAFLICGTLYVVYNSRHGGRSAVQCVYDIHHTLGRRVERSGSSGVSQVKAVPSLQRGDSRPVLPQALHQPQQPQLPPRRPAALHLGRRLPDRVPGGDAPEPCAARWRLTTGPEWRLCPRSSAVASACCSTINLCSAA